MTTTDLPGDPDRTDAATRSDEGTVRVRILPAPGPPTWVTHTMNPRCRECGRPLPATR